MNFALYISMFKGKFFFQIVCDRSHMFALGCAVARSFPLYTRKNYHGLRKKSTITVEFCFKGINNEAPSSAEIDCLTAAADGIRLAAEIVDTPCNEMHTDAFVEVCLKEIHCFREEALISIFVILRKSRRLEEILALNQLLYVEKSLLIKD